MQTVISRLTMAYERIGRERMAGLPIYNDGLMVEAVRFKSWDYRYVGVLITPWFMNYIAVPIESEEWNRQPIGYTVEISFPSGNYPFQLCFAPEIGDHLSLPLFSSVVDFPNQKTAREVAEDIQNRLFLEQEPPKNGQFSRRALFGMGGDKPRS